MALFLLLSVDLLLTMGAAALHGLEAEANPLMRWVLGQGLLVIIAVHVGVLLLAVAAFRRLLAFSAGLSGSLLSVYRLVIELWLGLLIAAGILVYANNLSGIVLGASLL